MKGVLLWKKSEEGSYQFYYTADLILKFCGYVCIFSGGSRTFYQCRH